MRELKNTVAQLVLKINEMSDEKGRLPSQTVPNPKSSINAVTVKREGLWHEEELNEEDPGPQHQPKDLDPERKPEDRILPKPSTCAAFGRGTREDPIYIDPLNDTNYNPFVQVPHGLKRPKLEKMEEDQGGTRTGGTAQGAGMNGRETGRLEKKTKDMPLKRRDPGPFLISITIGEKRTFTCVVDSGAEENILPEEFYDPEIMPTLTPVQNGYELADRSMVYSKGNCMDCEVYVAGEPIPVDFVIMPMKPTPGGGPPHILLGRPFMATTKMFTDSDVGIMFLNIPGQTIVLNRRGKVVMKDYPVDRTFQCTCEARTNPRWQCRCISRRLEYT